VNQHYEKLPFTLTFKYVLGTEESSETTIDLTTDMAEGDYFFIEFQKLGIQPVRVAAETPIHICGKSRCASNNRFYYGYEGYNYANFEGQDPDFTINYSSHN